MMLLPELIAMNAGDDGTVYSIADPDYLGFTRLGASPLGDDGHGPIPGDVVLVDLGMSTREPFDVLRELADQVAVIAVLPGRAESIALGRTVQSFVGVGLDLVTATEVEGIYGREVVVVAARGGPVPDPQHSRRVEWELALSNIVARAAFEAQRQRAEGDRAEVEQLNQTLAALNHTVGGLRAELASTAEADGEARRRLEQQLEDERREGRRLRQAPARKVGEAVLAMPRHPFAGAKAVGREIAASRRRHRSTAPKGTTSKESS